MKKLAKCFLLFSFMLLLNTILHSQTTLGFSAGSFKKFSDNSENYGYNIDLQNKFNFFFSFDIRTSSQEHFGIGTSFIYQIQSSKLTLTESYSHLSSSTQANLSYGYLDVYVFPEFKFGHKPEFYFNFGPCLGLIVHSKIYGIRYSTLYYPPPPTSDTNVINGIAAGYLNDVNVCFQVGLGLRFPVSEKTNLHVDLSNRFGNSDFEVSSFMYTMIFSAGVDFRIANK